MKDRWIGCRIAGLCALMFLAAACATIVSGGTQKIKVTSTPSGVTVTADPGGHRVTTPAEMALSRKGGPYRLKFEKQGYAPIEMNLSSGMNGWLWGNILIGGLIGIAIDFVSGAAYKLSPETVDANLTATGAQLGHIPTNTLLVFDQQGALLMMVRLQDS